MSASVPQIMQKSYIKHFRATNRKKKCYLHFDGHFVLVDLRVNDAAILDFFSKFTRQLCLFLIH